VFRTTRAASFVCAATALFCGASVGLLGLPAAAAASGASTSITLGGGSLSFSTTPSASNFANTTLTGSQQTIHTNFANWGVTDATGSNAGWHVTFAATQFSDGNGHTLPDGSLVLTAPAVSASGINLAVPPVLQGVTFTLDNANNASAPIVHALALTGQGAWTMTQANLLGGDLALTVPANATAGTYTSNLTFTLATGP
jgi:WxL domain surface cell wall-binding